MVHSDSPGDTYKLKNYIVAQNSLKNAKASSVVVNQTVGATAYGDAYNASIVVAQNNIYQPARDGIAVIGAYVGTGTTYGSTAVVGNIITDGLTDNPAPEAFACIRLQGATNVVVDGNLCIAPRWAGVCAHYDGRNLAITNNVIPDHQGRTSNGFGTGNSQSGGPIFVGAGSATAFLGDILVSGNVIRNYGTAMSPAVFYSRTGGIVINEAKVQNVTVKGNLIDTGNAAAISILNSVNVHAEGNDVFGTTGSGTALCTANGVGAGCVLTYAINFLRIGTTANRPSLVTEQKG